jgi:hypothetical protein
MRVGHQGGESKANSIPIELSRWASIMSKKEATISEMSQKLNNDGGSFNYFEAAAKSSSQFTTSFTKKR